MASSGRNPTCPGGGVGQRVSDSAVVGVGLSVGLVGVLLSVFCTGWGVGVAAVASASLVSRSAMTAVSAGGMSVGDGAAVHAER